MLLLTATAASASPTLQSKIYYNARAALREQQPTEALKLWMLRNTLESTSGRVSAHDPDFRSITWAALGELGLCQDGLPSDDDGAGIWPVAVHNWLVRTQGRSRPEVASSPFDAFRFGQQRRSVSIQDVLDADELNAVEFQRAGCLQQHFLLLSSQLPFGDLSDRRTRAQVLRSLLRQALQTLSPDKIVGRAAVEARLFDLDLVIAGLSARQARRNQRQLPSRRSTGPRLDAPPPASESERVVLRSLQWSAEEWMSLSENRRLFLFEHARQVATDREALRRLQLAIVDALIESQQGEELHTWLAWIGASGDKSSASNRVREHKDRQQVWAGSRGEKLLSLDVTTGFRERAAIALPRGIDSLAEGQLPQALRSLAYALRWAEHSSDPEAIRSLSLRWLSFVAAQFQVTEPLLQMLKNVLPRADFAQVLEDQLWHAALAADAPSFERCIRHQPRRTALTQRATMLRLLSTGDAGSFINEVGQRLESTPYFAEKLVRQFLERLQAEEASVRASHVPMLRELEVHLVRKAQSSNATRRRTHETLVRQSRALREGVVGWAGVGAAGRAQVLAPERQVFAGSVRLAPSDPLPWPFAAAPVAAPSAFAPLSLRPEEWSDGTGGLIFGWRIGD